MKVHEVITALKNEPSRVEKTRILKQYQDTPGLQLAFKLAYDPTINFWVTDAHDSGVKGGNGDLFHAMFELTTKIMTRELTGNAAQEYVNDLYTNLCEEDRVVFKSILYRNLGCGVGISTITEVWPHAGVRPFGVMLASTDIRKIIYPAYCQTKYDGARAVLTVMKNGSTLLSRGGNLFHDVVIHDLDKVFPIGTRLDGELLFLDVNGEVLPRKTGNGIANRAIKGNLPAEFRNGRRVHYVFWDMIPEDRSVPYSERYKFLKSKMEDNPLHLDASLAPTRIVNNDEEAREEFKKARAAGLEGIILKNTGLLWKEARVGGMVKMKEVRTADLQVVGLIPGTGKYTGMVGALACQTKCGKLMVDVGSGLSDADRAIGAIAIGSIVEVEYNEIITNKGSSTASLFLPVFCTVRGDKAEANALDELM